MDLDTDIGLSGLVSKCRAGNYDKQFIMINCYVNGEGLSASSDNQLSVHTDKQNEIQ